MLGSASIPLLFAFPVVVVSPITGPVTESTLLRASMKEAATPWPDISTSGFATTAQGSAAELNSLLVSSVCSPVTVEPAGTTQLLIVAAEAQASVMMAECPATTSKRLFFPSLTNKIQFFFCRGRNKMTSW